MDGFAVRAADVAAAHARLRVVATIGAGDTGGPELTTGDAAAIMTGAVVPAGADSVVKVEDCERDGDTVVVAGPVTSGSHIREPGADLRRGDVALEAPRLIRPADIGVAASVGVAVLAVQRRPIVAILATGDELVDLGRPLGPGQIANSNAYTLAAAVEEAGAVPRMLGIVADGLEATRKAFAEALAADVVLSTGGVSMGTFDVVRRALADLGVEERFWKVAQKPGKPISFGMRGTVPVFGLPGNPVSSLVCFYLYVRPALRRMAGNPCLHLPVVRARLGADVRTAPGLTEFVRVALHAQGGRRVAVPTGSQSSGVLRSMSLCDGLMIAPPGEGNWVANSDVAVLDLAGPAVEEAPFEGR